MTTTAATSTQPRPALPTRPHREDRAPHPLTLDTALFNRLNEEWLALCQLPSTSGTVRRWARQEPALTAARGQLGGILDAIDGADAAQQDRLLLALIRLTHGGQQLAGRVALQAMLPKLHQLARTSTWASDFAVESPPFETARGVLASTFWEVLLAYPAARRRSRVAANLALDTLHMAAAPWRTPDPPLRDLDDPDRRCVDPSEFIGVLPSDATVPEVLAWGLDVDAITRQEAQLLSRTYVDRPAGRRTAPLPAADRQRCSRAVRHLAQAVQRDRHLPTPPPTRRRSEHVRQHAVHLVQQHVTADGLSVHGACARVGKQLRISPATIRDWSGPARAIATAAP